jgi:hypothetical protein
VSKSTQDVSSRADGNQAMALPIDTRKLGEFIANLLGQRRRLSRDFDLNFFVDWPWIQNLDQLVMQRVEHQNEGNLVDFSLKLFLSNGRTTHLTTRADFETFRDFSSFESVGIEITWTFIVKFPTSAIPEKQEIRFLARTDELGEQKRGVKSKIPFFETLKIREEQMLVEIFYSNITWGEDLLQLISNHALSSFGTKNRIAQKIAVLTTRLSSPLVMILFLGSLMVELSSDLTGRYASFLKGLKSVAGTTINLDLLNAKLDVLLQ